jgi:hypothetical protein
MYSQAMTGRIFAARIAALLLVCLPFTAAVVQSDRQSAFFIGQVYPSGNVYLRAVESDAPQEPVHWPKTLILIPMTTERSAVSARTFDATLASGSTQPAHIPALEGMNDQHDACGSRVARKTEPGFQYLSEDFFDALSDYCEPGDDVAIYRAEASRYSFKVLGVMPGVTVTDIRSVSGPRPMASQDQQEVSRKKRQVNVDDCTTTPVYIDSAVRHMEASLQGGRTLRVSSYQTPGCAGHLATIYVLDILRGGIVLETFLLGQNQGVL